MKTSSTESEVISNGSTISHCVLTLRIRSTSLIVFCFWSKLLRPTDWYDYRKGRKIGMKQRESKPLRQLAGNATAKVFNASQMEIVTGVIRKLDQTGRDWGCWRGFGSLNRFNLELHFLSSLGYPFRLPLGFHIVWKARDKQTKYANSIPSISFRSLCHSLASKEVFRESF